MSGMIVRLKIGMSAAAMLAAIGAAAPAAAGCTRTIINRSSLTASISRDGGPAVTIPPHRSQAIRYEHPGTLAYTLTCGRGASAPVYTGSFNYSAIIDRCYIAFGDGFFEDQLGPGFFGTQDTKPLTLNNPRQGDVVIGPVVDAACPAPDRVGLRSQY